MKKIVLLLLAFCLFACTNTANNTNDDNLPYCDITSDSCLNEEFDYEEFMNGNNVFEEITMQEAIDKFKNQESGIIYFGFSTCPWCIEALPIMNEVAASMDKKIYYVATRDSERNLNYTDEEKAEILKYIGEFEDADDDGNKQIYVPLVITFENGISKKANLGTVDDHDAHERKMTDEEKENLKEIYTELFK